MRNRNTSVRYALTCLAALPWMAGCVSASKYDDAVKSADSARAELRNTKKADQAKIGELQQKLEDQTNEDTRLRQELEKLGADAKSLAVEKGDLAAALAEVRRAHVAADIRARTYQALALKLKKMVDAGDLSIVLRDGRMVLQLPSDVLFESGQIDIKPRGQTALKQIASVLKTLEGRHFQIAGHTDNVPIDTPRFPSNWELSTARGVEVVRYLVSQGVAPGLLAATGYGEFDPIASNDDPKGRARNRRIEISLQPNVNEIVAIPDNK